MLNWLRRWLSATPDEIERLEARQDELEREWQQMELNLTGLTDKLNEAIRARRRSRFQPLNGAE
jgi:predicted  nucleic acid-binding Zn-ribbon protein